MDSLHVKRFGSELKKQSLSFQKKKQKKQSLSARVDPWPYWNDQIA